MNNVISYNDLLKTKGYVNSAGTIYPTPEIICKDLKALHKGEHYVNVSYGASNANSDKTINQALDRWSLISKQNLADGIHFEVGILVAYDLKTPTIKAFAGSRVAACLNLCVFSDRNLVKTELLTATEPALEAIKQFMKEAEKIKKEQIAIIERLKSTHITEPQMHELFGKMIFKQRKTNAVCGINGFTSAISDLSDAKSKYYFENDKSLWNIYNACTEHNSQKVSFFDQPEKALSYYELLQS